MLMFIVGMIMWAIVLSPFLIRDDIISFMLLFVTVPIIGIMLYSFVQKVDKENKQQEVATQ